jgi:hypothetical protein
MNTDLIDSILNDINSSEEYILKIEDINQNGATMLQYREIISFLCKQEFILQPFTNHGKLTLLEKGKELLRLGGYEEYLKSEREKQNRINEKVIFDLRISKFQANYGKYALHISALALLVAIGSFITATLMYKSRIKELEMKQQEIDKKIETIDSIQRIPKIKYNP